MGEDGKKNRDAFYRDVKLDGEQVNNKFRVQLTIKNKDNNYDLFKIIEENQDINIYIDHDPTLI